MFKPIIFTAAALCVASLARGADSPRATVATTATEASLDRHFHGTVRPFVDTYCASCHGKDKQEGELDLSSFQSTSAVVNGFGYWELVLERLEAADMPPSKAKKHPTDAQRHEITAWLQALRKNESAKNAGDPGPVLARRLSHAEYDYTIRDLTGADIRPTKEFPVDPANQAGFANSGESLSMSPALVKKYLQAARTVAEHLILKPDGFAFAPHPVVADTDRDKYAVLRIVDFYRRQPTDYADYFAAAWRYQHRVALGKANASLADIAAENKVSSRYLATIWGALTEPNEAVGPLARLQAMWRELPGGAQASPPARPSAVRSGCEQMRDYVLGVREKIVPEVKNLSGFGIQNGSQTYVLWKNRQMAANRRRFDPAALQIEGAALAMPEKTAALPGPTAKAEGYAVAPSPPAKASDASTKSGAPTKAPVVQTQNTPEVIRKGGKFLAPAITTTGSSATFKMAANRNRSLDPELTVPADPAARARHETAFARFADIFPDAFYITERARVYMDAEKEKSNAGRLLSAGLHSMTGYFRDDGPLYDLVLDDAGRRELDALWREFDFASSVPQRMHTSFVWFERTDSSYLRDPEFDPFRPEDKSVTDQPKIQQLAELYLAKAIRNNATAAVQAAITEHFERVAANIRRVEQDRAAAEPAHVTALLEFAGRAFRRPLTSAERDGLMAFYRSARIDNGGDHEEAIRDGIVRILMSPHFCYRIDLVEAAGDTTAVAERLPVPSEPKAAPLPGPPGGRALPLSDHALASRLSYFLWSSQPDADLLACAARGELRRPDVLAAQARRMLQDGRIRNFATEFAGHWLDFRRFEEHNAVDRERFPTFDPELRSAMFEEPLRFFAAVAREGRPVLDFLHGDYTFVNAPLARHYGMPAPVAPDADGWARIDRASAFERGGLLPMAVFLTANSPGLRTSPVKRGYWVVRRVLGERIPPPPATVPDLPADEKSLGDLTLREVLAKHRDDKACASCHARFDSFGLVFEGFGPVGERRTQDFGERAVDTRAEFPGGRAGTGLVGLRDYIHDHREADFIDNLCRKLVAYALGRTLLMSDDALVTEMKTKLAANGHRFNALVETIVASPQFRLKRAPLPAAAKTASLP